MPPSSAPFWIRHDPQNVPPRLSGGHVAIGNFDGVHRGHRMVLETARDRAHALGRPAIALTFEPHPRSFFRPDRPVFRLTDSETKIELFRRLGLDGAAVLTFDEALAGLTAEDFVRRVLVERLAARVGVVGYDFHFGKGRAGSPQVLEELGRRLGFETVLVAPVGGFDPVSASAIRSHLAAGRIADANRLLGYRWFVQGTVIRGDQRGRALGYPTANIALDPACRLMHGIYAVRVAIADQPGTLFDAVASFGRRPTFDDGPPLLEVFLFDFSGDLYDRTLEVEFLAMLRPEERFDSAEALVAQMDRDAEAARAVLADARVDDDAPSMLE
jgi:riboflavin kinase/FMN adenylyltransferase